jgi:hypothetical protein
LLDRLVDPTLADQGRRVPDRRVAINCHGTHTVS